jgi:tetratricopeptide (TPR) repeat protein
LVTAQLKQAMPKDSKSIFSAAAATLLVLSANASNYSFAQSAPSLPPPTPQQAAAYEQAGKLLDQGKIIKAREALLRLRSTVYGQNDAMLYCRLADTYLADDDPRASRLQNAEACLKKSLAIDPEFGPAYRNMAGLCIDREQYAPGVQWGTRALTCKKPDKTVFWLRSRCYYELNKLNEALADMNAFMKLPLPKKTGKHYSYLGELYKAMGRNDDAIKVYRQAIPFGRDWAESQIVRCLESQNKLPEAIKEVSDIVKKNPADDDGYHIRARLLVKNKDLKGALADFTKAIELEPLSQYYRERAAVYESLGQHDLAVKDLAQAKANL